MMNKEQKIYKELCTGCGLCKSILGIEMKEDAKGVVYPELEDDSVSFCKVVCPASGNALSKQSNEIWGKAEKTYLGWSCDENIRRQASTGGLLTSLCCYLLDTGLVDGIIQTKVDTSSVIKTTTIVSRNSNDVKSCMGSRYTASSPLSNIKDILESGGTYAFVGKPCDVSALRIYMDYNNTVTDKIKFVFSFFCAGVPSRNANLNLLTALGCNEDNCSSLTYRGNGWPGFASAIKNNGSSSNMTYEESWGKVLGRDIRKICRYCMDGIGEMADVACGDAWYLTNNKKPDFSEGDGRNVCFARTYYGVELLKMAEEAGYIHIEAYDEYAKELPYIQTFQLERKETMYSMMLAVKMFGRRNPFYDMNKLKQFSRKAPLKLKLKRFLGTVKRIKAGRL